MSSRDATTAPEKGKEPISPHEAHWRLTNLYLILRDKDYFKEKLKATLSNTPDELKRLAIVRLGFEAFPLENWTGLDKTEDRLFGAIEFLYDQVSKPGDWADFSTDTGYNYQDYGYYDSVAGRHEFREAANLILADLGNGYELGHDGQIRSVPTGGLEYIVGAIIPQFDERDVDNKVRTAIEKWRKRHVTLEDKKEAVRLLADVFEWLKKTKQLEKALVSKDESDLFHIANNFSIRHHGPAQKAQYDQSIWYNWMFHFYLATYHASVRLLLKQRATLSKPPR